MASTDVPWDVPSSAKSAMEKAARLRDIARDMKPLTAALASLKEEASALQQEIERLMINGELSESFKVPDGGTVYMHKQLWAGPIDGDHAALTAVLKELDLVEYLPSTVNSQSFSAFVREHLDPATKRDNRILTLEERLLSDEPKPLDPRLLAVIKATDKRTVKVTGA